MALPTRSNARAVELTFASSATDLSRLETLPSVVTQAHVVTARRTSIDSLASYYQFIIYSNFGSDESIFLEFHKLLQVFVIEFTFQLSELLLKTNYADICSQAD